MKKYTLWGVGGVVLLVLVVWWNSSPKSSAEYETTTLSGGVVRSTVEVVGSVTPQEEIKLTFQNAGKIQKIYYQEGAKVASGAVLAEINTDDIKKQVQRDEAAVVVAKANLTKVMQGIKIEDKMVLETAVSNAEKNLEQAKATYEATKKSTEGDIAYAQTTLENAKKVYEATGAANTTVNNEDITAAESSIVNAKKALAATQISTEQSIKVAQANILSAETALENAKKNVQTGAPVQDKNLSKAQEDSFYSAVNQLNEVDNSLRAINTIITVEEYNKDQNSKYRELLGVQKNNSYNETVTAYYELKAAFSSQKNLFVITDRGLSYAEIVARLEQLKILLDKAHTSLSVTYEMLQYSLTSKDFPQSSLDSARTSILTQRTLVTNSLAAISSVKKNVESLELQRTSNVTTLNNAVDTAQRALATAQENLASVRAQGMLQETNAKNAVKNAEDNLQKAKANLSNKELTVLNAQNAYSGAVQNLENAKAKAQTQIQSAQTAVVSGQSQLATAKANLAAQSAPARVSDVDAAKAQVLQAEANLAVTKTKLDQTKITAPGEGVISTIALDEGEQASPSVVVITMISEDVETIEANVAETEIGKIAVGNKVLIDFDAFPSDHVYEGTVSFINPDKVSTDGVINYRIQVSFSKTAHPGNMIRPGMTANLNIIAQQLEGVDVLPNQALKEEFTGGKSASYVEVLVGKGSSARVEKRVIQLGERGDEYTQVRSGLSKEELVILYTKVANGK